MEKILKREHLTESGGDPIVMEATDEFTREHDPVSKRRTIRSSYREIEYRINEGRDELANSDSNKFMAIMNEVENMHQHVKKPREQVADAETLLGLTRTLAASVKTHTSGGVTPAEFVSCLIREFGQQNSMKRLSENSPYFSWQSIGLLVSTIFMNGPGCMTLWLPNRIGPLKNTLKPRKLVVRAKRSRSIRNARPKELDKAAEAVTDTEKLASDTVENLFALSFLVKDGRVRIDVDESGSQVVVPTNGPSAEEMKSGVVRNHQFVFRFDFNDWKLMKTMVPEGGERMPRRDAFANASYAKAKMGMCDLDFTPAEGIRDDSRLILTAPVKKLSRNHGGILQNTCLFEIDDDAFGNWNCKRKRSVM
ncbi:hypothetical protein OROHE_008377 [Orobanche hederae]